MYGMQVAADDGLPVHTSTMTSALNFFYDVSFPTATLQIPALSTTGARPLRTVRISLVGISRQQKNRTDGSLKTNNNFPLDVENHIPPKVGVGDGYQRTLYTRRLEMPNLAPASL